MKMFSFLDHLNLIEDDASQYEVGISDEGFSYLDMGSERRAKKFTFAEKQSRETTAALDGSTRARGQSNLKATESIDHDEICFDTDLISILRDIESRRNKISIFPGVVGISIIVVLLWLYFILNLSMPILGFILSSIFVLPLLAFGLVNAWFFDRSRKDVHFEYKIIGKGRIAYDQLNNALESVHQSGQILLYSGRQHFSDSRYTGGADSLPELKEIACDLAKPPLLDLPFKVWHIRAFKRDLFFMPDHILIFDGANMGGVNYAKLTIDSSVEVAQVRGTAKVTSDSKVIGNTYRFVNKDGSPDKRFNNNIEIPLVEYGVLNLTGSGLEISLYVTDQKSAFGAPERFSDITNLARKPIIKVAEQRRRDAELRRKMKQEEIYSVVLDSMMCVMYADGEASNAEKEKVRTLMQKIRSPWKVEEIEQKLQAFQIRISSQGLNSIVEELRTRISMIENVKQQIAFRKCLNQVMSADGEVHPKSAQIQKTLVSSIRSNDKQSQ